MKRVRNFDRMSAALALLMLLIGVGWCRGDGSYGAVLKGGDEKAQGKDYAGARTQYRFAMSLAPNVNAKVDVQRRIVQTYIGEEDVEAARSEYLQIMEIAGVSPDQKLQVCQWIGDTYTNKEQRGQMRAEWAKALAIDGVSANKKVEMVQRIAKSFVEDGRIEEARTEYGLVLDDEATSPEQKANACIWIADTYAVTQRLAVRAELAKGLTIEGLAPQRKSELLQRIAKSFVEEGRLEEARAEYGMVFTVGGMSADQKATACQWIADTYPGKQRAEAREQLARGAAIEGVSPQIKHDLLNRVADSYVREGRTAEARAECAKILDVTGLAPDKKVGVLNRNGKSYAQEGLLDDARKEYAKVLGLAGANPEQKATACQWIADTYSPYVAEERARAREELAKGAAIEGVSLSTKISMQQRIGKSFAEEGKPDEARKEYAKVLSIAGVVGDQKAKACQWSADTYSIYSVEQRAQARAELSKAATIEGVSAGMKVDLFQRIGRSFAEEGKLEEARQEYAKVLSIAGLGADQKATACIWCYDTYLFAQRAEARAELGKALALEGVSVNMKADLLNRLRIGYAESGKVEEAMAEAQKLVDLKDAPKSLKDQAKKYLDDNK